MLGWDREEIMPTAAQLHTGFDWDLWAANGSLSRSAWRPITRPRLTNSSLPGVSVQIMTPCSRQERSG
jgi:hypothetical protein